MPMGSMRPKSAGARPAGAGYLTRPPSGAAKRGWGGEKADEDAQDAQQRGADPKQVAAALFARGEAEHERGDLHAAVGLYKRAISLDSTVEGYYSARALAYMVDGTAVCGPSRANPIQ